MNFTGSVALKSFSFRTAPPTSPLSGGLSILKGLGVTDTGTVQQVTGQCVVCPPSTHKSEPRNACSETGLRSGNPSRVSFSHPGVGGAGRAAARPQSLQSGAHCQGRGDTHMCQSCLTPLGTTCDDSHQGKRGFEGERLAEGSSLALTAGGGPGALDSSESPAGGTCRCTGCPPQLRHQDGRRGVHPGPGSPPCGSLCTLLRLVTVLGRPALVHCYTMIVT